MHQDYLTTARVTSESWAKAVDSVAADYCSTEDACHVHSTLHTKHRKAACMQLQCKETGTALKLKGVRLRCESDENDCGLKRKRMSEK